MSNIHAISVRRIDGSPTTLAEYRGDVLLIVNVASQCGLTPQYAALEKLYQQKWEQGLQILAFPTNDFGGQEPGQDAEIEKFCTLTYDVHFPMFSKISAKGEGQHPLYAALVNAQPRAVGDRGLRAKLIAMERADEDQVEVLWNFEKFLVDRKGHVVARFSPDLPPDDPQVLAAIDAELRRD